MLDHHYSDIFYQIFYEIFYVDLYDVGEVKIGMNVDHADVTNNLTRQS